VRPNKRLVMMRCDQLTLRQNCFKLPFEQFIVNVLYDGRLFHTYTDPQH